MREFLFRGKRIDNGEWIEGYYAMQSNHACFASALRYQYFIFKDVCTDFDLGGLQRFEVNPETVGQYTGLTDKNGKKIFEGDIVEVNRKEAYGKVEFDKDDAAFTVVCDSVQYSFVDHLWGTDVEVVGNIYDNPELLEMENG